MDNKDFVKIGETLIRLSSIVTINAKSADKPYGTIRIDARTQDNEFTLVIKKPHDYSQNDYDDETGGEFTEEYKDNLLKQYNENLEVWNEALAVYNYILANMLVDLGS